MEEIKHLKDQISLIAEEINKHEKKMDSLKASTDKLKAYVENATITLADVDSARDKPQLTPNQLAIVDNHLVGGLSFKPTTMIADYLRSHDDEFKFMNNFQIGILLAKAGFKSGYSKKARGYFVSYKRL